MKPGDHPEFFRFPAPAGTSRESTIRLSREGRFTHDGDAIDHPKLEAALHSWIARHPDDGRYMLTNGYDWTYFIVDDAPFVVRHGHVSSDGSSFVMTLSNDDVVTLDPHGLTEGDDGALYATVTVKGQPFEARFSQHAQAALGPLLIEANGRVGVRAGDEIVVPKRRVQPPTPAKP